MEAMTPSQQLQFAHCRFKLSVLSLMLLLSAFLFYNIFLHSVNVIALGYALVYIIVLNVGMRGATNRSIGMLRFYWIFQLIQLIVVLLSVLGLVAMFSFMRLHRLDLRGDVIVHPVKLPNQNVDADNTLPQLIPKHPLVNSEDTVAQVDQNPREVHFAHVNRSSYSCPFTSAFHFILPALIFLIVIFSKTRSIVLARQLIALIEANAGNDIESDSSCCEKECGKESCEEKTPTPAPAEVAPVAVYSPEAVYIMPQTYVMPGADGSYPGLMPVYVDKNGKATE